MKRKLSIDQHVIQFCRFLRENGFAAGPTEEVDVLNALVVIDWGDRKQFKEVLKAVLVKNINQFHLFDELYAKYWRYPKVAEYIKNKYSQDPAQKTNDKQQTPTLDDNKNSQYDSPQNSNKEV
ncbi:MAG: hypothetical protein F6K30_30615 [Cyanothece sp. SIO2G6]|nr:hypothetical protein [Cyanothece sp. SIO2G6]